MKRRSPGTTALPTLPPRNSASRAPTTARSSSRGCDAAMTSGLSVARLKRLTDGMQGFVDRGVVTGVVTLIHRHGVEAHCDVLGFQDEEARQPMRRDTIFRIASMTKPIVSVATLMLLEEGKLRLDDPIERWLPEFANPRVLRDPA